MRERPSPVTHHASRITRHASHSEIEMDINRFTEKAQEAVRGSQTLATRYGNQQVEVEHLLHALLDQQGGLVPSTLTRAGVNIEPLKESVERDINKMPKVTGPSGPVDQ